MIGTLTGIELVDLASFVGRKKQIKKLQEVDSDKEASVVVVKGRRRIGKTELIEQYYKDRNVLKFEGIQCKTKLSPAGYEKDKKRQIDNCFKVFKRYLSLDARDVLSGFRGEDTLNEDELRFKRDLENGFRDWAHFFEILDSYLKQGDILYFEEIQWLSSYSDNFLSELKPFWDNYYRKISNLRLIICGSSPSFITNKFAADQALKGRSITWIDLRPLMLSEVQEFLGVGPREAIRATLCVGGVCEYLKKIKIKINNGNSVKQALQQLSTESGSYLVKEYDEIFVSSMQHNKHYKKIIEILAKNRCLTTNNIAKKLKIKSGGSLLDVLDDLVECEFIEKNIPILKGENSKDVRYAISDEYLHFYHRFLGGNILAINNGDYEDRGESLIDSHQLSICMGFIFEKWCRKNHRLLAEIMNFDQVKYISGPEFSNKAKDTTRGYQLDLMYVRDDDILVFCEIKKYDQNLTDNKIVDKLKDSADLFIANNKKYENYTRKYCIINPEGMSASFDRKSEIDYLIKYDDLGAR
ncbi:MAG: hypothetical protein KAG61_13250 [Bacteriovoracaceae bacterium]|nr:hypothetical protein [Bacteriovoracaceae bacterium]